MSKIVCNFYGEIHVTFPCVYVRRIEWMNEHFDDDFHDKNIRNNEGGCSPADYVARGYFALVKLCANSNFHN